MFFSGNCSLKEQAVCYLLQLLGHRATSVTKINTHAYLFLFSKTSLFIGDKIQAVGLKGSETQT